MGAHKNVRIERKRDGNHRLCWTEDNGSYDREKSEWWNLDTLRGFISDRKFMEAIEKMEIGTSVDVAISIEPALRIPGEKFLQLIG